jgi:hypothetical protein
MTGLQPRQRTSLQPPAGKKIDPRKMESAIGSQIAVAAAHPADLYEIALRREQFLRCGQVLSLRGGAAEYLFHIGSGEVGLADGIGLLVSGPTPYGVGDGRTSAIGLARRRCEEPFSLQD